MKKIILLFLVSMCIQISNAQKSIIGKWKPVKITIPNLGEMPIEENALREFMYKKSIDENAGVALTAADTSTIEQMITQVIEQFSTMTMEFKADKKYLGIMDNKEIVGTYLYDPKKRLLTTKPKGKPQKTASVSFKDGFLLLVNTKEKVSICLEKML
jgi:hypothetical protein